MVSPNVMNRLSVNVRTAELSVTGTPPFSRFVIYCCLERSDNMPLKSSEYKLPSVLPNR
jgi:hypothetical protein